MGRQMSCVQFVIMSHLWKSFEKPFEWIWNEITTNSDFLHFPNLVHLSLSVSLVRLHLPGFEQKPTWIPKMNCLGLEKVVLKVWNSFAYLYLRRSYISFPHKTICILYLESGRSYEQCFLIIHFVENMGTSVMNFRLNHFRPRLSYLATVQHFQPILANNWCG